MTFIQKMFHSAGPQSGRAAWLSALAIASWVCLPSVAWGQVKAGEAELTGLSGVVSAGYSDTFGNLQTSSHSLDFGAVSSLNGYYHNPNFLSFNLSPFYNQSRANSDSQSITDSSGFLASSSLFSGSHFPGTLSYSREYNGTGIYAVPGLTSYTTNSNNDALGINWGFNFKDLPNVSVFYLRGHNDYSIYGMQSNGNASYQQGGIRANYTLAGFNLNAGYNKGTTDALVPQFNEPVPLLSSSDNQSFSFGGSHRLPWNGGMSVGLTRSEYSSDSQLYAGSGTVNSVFTSINLQPTSKLTLLTRANYTDNLQGLLNESIISSGGVLQPIFTGYGARALDITNNANYIVTQNLTVGAQVNRQEQSDGGLRYGSTSVGGNALYLCRCLGGSASASLSVFDVKTDNLGSSIGLNTGVNYSRSIGMWDVNASFNYAQNAQTVLAEYLTSYLTYNGNVSRRLGRFLWYASAGGGNSMLVQQAGTSSRSLTFSTGLSGRLLSGNVNYAHSSGTGILTPSGIVPSPVPSPILLPTSQIFYGGNSYGFSLAITPVSRMLISMSYSKSASNTASVLQGSNNTSEIITSRFQYQLRKVTLIGGYTRLKQGFSLTPGPPVDTSTVYAGISRSFNFF